MNNAELTSYLNDGIKELVSGVLKSTFSNPKETAYLLKFLTHSEKNAKTREDFEKDGLHVPAFLIASITNSCNLFCKGCYARANGICGEKCGGETLPAEKWNDLFTQASDLGITFCLLAGGEPLLRKDVLEQAAKKPEIIFPIFTNGTVIDEYYIKLLDRHRNLIPIFSVEGGREQTDERRGTGTYEKIMTAIDALGKKKILFGASVTVTTQNLNEVTSDDFLDLFNDLGCRLIFYIEYVPADGKTELAPTEKERRIMDEKLNHLRRKYPKMMFLSFPGDEQYMGGCLAAGRGFFHIGPNGAAEACPFSPYSDTDLKSSTLKDALQSPFFRSLQERGLSGGEHDGGCTLFENEDTVRECLKNCGK
ncbi:MAG TPA: radical SAM protein [Oscillospiraceae bacterium]|nr:radical SAM protein [Oscillospiraceae bacterium]HPF55747.1 radical SAM protein [Clostridiales bacterium]HPK34256.1 radical SAM protein [Oscillospiraceae bacterium]HPR74841.1 radical SAM protein [Oscillospiraceae bacterium]